MQIANTKTHDSQTDEELADVLTAISVVAKRLAQKLNVLSREAQEETKGENQSEQDE